jgi:hypothetical protein
MGGIVRLWLIEVDVVGKKRGDGYGVFMFVLEIILNMCF